MFPKEFRFADDGRNGPARMGQPVKFKDSHGLCWTVCEHDGRSIPGHQNDTCLIFKSEYSMRRVWTYPADWQDMPATALEEMSWRR